MIKPKIKILKEFGSLNHHPKRVKALWFQNSTFFDPLDSLQVKYEMIRCVKIEGISKIEAAKLFGVSRPTFYEAESAFLHSGLVGLLPQQRGPKEAHKLNANVMDFIKNCLIKDKELKPKALAKLVNTHFNIVVHTRSIERALTRKKKVHKNT